MKKLLTLLLVGLVVFSNAQEKNAATASTMMVAINAEQMLEKMGFEHLMSAVFDQRKVKSENQKLRATTIRKSLAAIYGAGIDFKRKVWITYAENRFSKFDLNATNYNYVREQNYPIIIIPVANKQVFLESIQKMIDLEKSEYNDVTVKTDGAITYIQSNSSLFVMTDKDFYITGMPSFYASYDYYKGKTIHIDTVQVERNQVKQFAPPVADYDKKEALTEQTPVKPVTIIDKIDNNGSIKRVYKKKAEVYPHDKVFSDTPVMPPMAEQETVAVPAESAVMDTAANAVTNEKFTREVVNAIRAENGIPQKKDTIIRTEYLNDSTELRIYFVEYTQNERDSIIKVRDAEQIIKKENYIVNFIAKLNQYLPTQNPNGDITKMMEAKEDAALYVNSDFGSSFGMYNPIVQLKTMTGTMDNNNNVGYVGTINFENGIGTIKAASSCCTGANTVNNMYYPLTNFWPAALGNKNMGTIRYHMNVPELMKFYKNMFPPELEMEKAMAKEGFSFKDIEEVFEGEIAMTLNTAKPNEYGRVEPKMTVALKLKNAAKAVEMMNKIGNKSLDFTNHYKFDEKGTYLLVSSDNFGPEMTTKTPVAVTTKTTLTTGNFGEIKMDIRALVDGLTRERKKKNTSFELVKNFFGKMEMVNNKTEDGSFIGEMWLDLGDKNTNGLYNIIELAKNITKAEMERRRLQELEMLEYDKKMESKRKQVIQKNNSKKDIPTKRKVTKRN